MGYELHITRAQYWSMNEGHEITAEEWLGVVESDPELKLAGNNGPFFTLWIGTSAHVEPWFDWLGGNIYTKNPDEPIMEKMVEIARRLDAKVQGDDGEVYLGNGKDTSYE